MEFSMLNEKSVAKCEEIINAFEGHLDEGYPRSLVLDVMSTMFLGTVLNPEESEYCVENGMERRELEYMIVHAIPCGVSLLK